MRYTEEDLNRIRNEQEKQKNNTRDTTASTPDRKHPNYDSKFGWDDETPDSWRHLPEDRED